MRRVLEIFGEPISRGGQESYVISVLQNIDMTGLSIDLFTPYYCDNEAYQTYVEDKGGTVYAGNVPFRVGGSRREILPVLKAYLTGKEYDVVHIHSGSIAVLAYSAMIASKAGIKKVIVHSHSSGRKKTLKHCFIKCYSAHLFKKYATDYCACSLEAAQWKFPKRKMAEVQILKNGVDLKKFSYNKEVRKEMRKKYNISDDTLVLGHVGRFTHEKNQIFLMDILRAYIGIYAGQKVVMILVGDGAQMEFVKNKAERLQIADKVIFTGKTDDVKKYMQCFDIFVFPSLYEGFGIAGVEAQASGLPVIASDAVPKTMQVTDYVKFVSLQNIVEWCNAIAVFQTVLRIDTSSEIRKKGFDIHDTSKKVFEMYI